MATALELSRERWQDYVEAARQRPQAPALTPTEHRARQQLLQTAHQAATLLKTRFYVRRVVLFGSLAHQAWFSLDSDVDLAVEGLQGRSYWEAWRAVEDLFADCAVDLIEIEAAAPSLRQAIERHGIEL